MSAPTTPAVEEQKEVPPNKPEATATEEPVKVAEDGGESTATPTEFFAGSFDNLNFFTKYFTYTFATPLVNFAAKGNGVEASNLWEVPENDKIEGLRKRFDEAVDAEMAAKPDQPRPYYRPLFSTAKPLIICGAFFIMIRVLAEVFLPVLVREIIQRIEDNDFNGLYFVLGFFGVSAVGQIANQMHLRCMELASNRLRAVSNYAIFRHSLHLRSATFGDRLSDIVTLVASDTQRFVDVHAHAHLMWASPVQIALGTYFLVQFVSLPGLIAVGVMMALYPYSAGLAMRQANVRRKLLSLTEKRVRSISEFLQGVRVVKMYGWEKYLLAAVKRVREGELACLWKELMYWSAAICFLITIPNFALTFTFLLYIEREDSLTAANAFASLAMLALLKFPVMYFGNSIMIGLQAKVGCDRIAAFLRLENDATEEDLAVFTVQQSNEDKYQKPAFGDAAGQTVTSIPSPTEADEGENGTDASAAVALSGAVFEWGTGGKQPVPKESKEPAKAVTNEPIEVVAPTEDEELSTTPFKFQLGDLNLSIPKGSCTAVMGAVGSGKTMLALSLLRETQQQAGTLKVPQSVAYAAQESYLMSGTVRDNIVFFRPFDESKYRRVIEACQLWPDLDSYTDGEMTIVGERGVTLSGGQKARIALARAVYADDADLVILDDPFSALDARTGRMVLEALLGRPNGLLRHQAVMIVTHARGNLWAADHLIELSEGNPIMSPSSPSADACLDSAATPSDAIQGDSKQNPDKEADEAEAKKNAERPLASVSTNKLIKAESKESTVSPRTYVDFFRFGGGVIFAVCVFGGILSERIAFASTDTWLSVWTSAADGEPRHWIGQKYDFPPGNTKDGARFYLRVYAVMVCITHVLACFRLLSFARGGVNTSRNLFQQAFEKLTKCPMEFFDSTPVGRVLNRMSHDVERVGYPLITQLNAMYATSAWMMTGVIVTGIILPYNLIVMVPGVALMVYFLLRFRNLNVHLQRLDAIARSNLQGHIFESIMGAPTIRAFGTAKYFLGDCQRFIDANTRSLYAVAMCQRWVGMRTEFLAVFCMSYVVLMAWLMRDSLAGGVAGMSIVWGMNAARSVTFAVTEGVQGEAKLVSVERLVDYIENLEQEPPRITEAQPAESWPSKGRVEFRNVAMRYRPGLPLVLNDCSFTVEAGTRVGLVGRTGSGKSSTIVALFRLRELVAGSIIVDDVDIAGIGLDGLRGGGMSIIPQDPVLFSGTVRSNVDPFDHYNDEQVTSALGAVHLLPHVEAIGGLGAVVEERGRNFSVGQRQLLCIARALLRNPRILLMDEATANVDNETDELIQVAVRNLFRNSTVIEIAHRLHTVMDADRVIVMSDGHVAQTGTPAELSTTEGIFSSMVDATGPETAAELRHVAAKAALGGDSNTM